MGICKVLGFDILCRKTNLFSKQKQTVHKLKCFTYSEKSGVPFMESNESHGREILSKVSQFIVKKCIMFSLMAVLIEGANIMN